MKSFKNFIKSIDSFRSEPSIKRGNSLPVDSVNLGWYSADEVTPENFLSVLDLSNTIPENGSQVRALNDDFSMYADEFGVLRYLKNNSELHQLKHSPIVKNSEVSISNLIISKTEQVKQPYNFTNVSNFEDLKFAHSVYVSRFYTILAGTGSTYTGIETSPAVNDPDRYNIRVVDDSGNKYADAYGEPKYRIHIEKYPNIIKNSSLDFYKIIVLMDSPDPVNLYLIYDKYEKNSSGIPYNQFLNYREYINAVPAYTYVVEESEVIDPSSISKRVYSTQMFAHKENKLLKNKTNDNGWKIVTPKKAIQDPRTFQNFNWRLLAKINYNFSKNKDIHESAERARLNVAVLYSGLIENIENPYVFANLEESVINQQNFLFENPLASIGSRKNERLYWALNIDTIFSSTTNVSNVDVFSYDFLIWSPNSQINEHQKRTIDLLLSNGVSIFIDCSNLNQASLTASGLNNFDFTLSSTENNTGLIKIIDEYVNGNESFNAWNMAEYNESSIGNFGIFGDRKNILSNNSIYKIRAFNGSPESSDGSARSISYLQDGNNRYSTILRDKYNSASEFSAFSIFCLNSFLTFINDNYGGSGLLVSGKNNGSTNRFPVGVAGSQIASLSEAVIGPNKMFYNIICESNKNKVNSRQQYSNDSVIVWNISPWRNSWTINGRPDEKGDVTVLFDDEKRAFKFGMKMPESMPPEDGITLPVIKNFFCREINSSIGELLIQDFEATSNEVDAATMINSDFSNVDFYIECTNDNVKFLNFDKIDNSNYIFANVKTSYSIHQIASAAKNKIAGSGLSMDAYSIVYSRQFDLDSIYYPHIVLDYSDYFAQVNSVIKTPREYLPGSQFVRDYDYQFKTQIFVTKVTTNRFNYEVNWSSPFTLALDGESSNITVTTQNAIADTPEGNSSADYGAYDDTKYQQIPVRNRESPFHLYRYPTNVFSVTDILYRKFDNISHTRNNFHYTNDLPITRYWDEYMLGKAVGSDRDYSPSPNPGGGGGGVGGGVDTAQVMMSDSNNGNEAIVYVFTGPKNTQLSNTNKSIIGRTNKN